MAEMGEWLVAAIGTWKAGGILVPLEAEEPQGRKKLMMEDGEVELIITREGWGEEYEALGKKVLYVDGEGEKREARGVDKEEGEEEGSGRVACMLYRSSGKGKLESVWVE